ncbi:unnamed protein product [Adineta steineri]|uniref:Uncharacterized protein n=2 Tax=Adineta steineri TaxID=433720 RepID=A0A814VF43_9BILA|nr:unnamed protein product [Adineta steineri]
MLSNNSLVDIVILTSGSSLTDMLNQQPCSTTDSNNSTVVKFIKATKSYCQQTQNSKSNCKDNRILPAKKNDDTMSEEKLSTLFKTTGRERNSTGPLKQWLYQNQDHPYPNENERDELIKKTNMSSSQITIWFTNARAKMRKENRLPVKINGKKQKKIEGDHDDDLHELKKILDLSFSSDDNTNESIIDSLLQCNEKRIVVAYSCLNIQQITNLRCFVVQHSNEISISDCIDDHTTHLIIGNEEKPLLCPLTMKLFQSIARHLYVISYEWINECLNQNHIVDEINYEIRGDIPFGEYHDGMRKSRLSKQMKLFENCKFFILCDDCQDNMTKNELASLIQLCHGSLLNTFPLTTDIDDSILTIVLCYELLPFDNLNQQELFILSRSNGVHFLHPEWILESIVQFSLQPFECYEEKF